MNETSFLPRVSIERSIRLKINPHSYLKLFIIAEYNPGASVGTEGMTQKQYFLLFVAKKARFSLSMFCT